MPLKRNGGIKNYSNNKQEFATVNKVSLVSIFLFSELKIK